MRLYFVTSTWRISGNYEIRSCNTRSLKHTSIYYYMAQSEFRIKVVWNYAFNLTFESTGPARGCVVILFLYMYTVVVSVYIIYSAFMRNITIISDVAVTMPGTASKAADNVSSRAPELTFCPGSMNVNSGTLYVFISWHLVSPLVSRGL